VLLALTARGRRLATPREGTIESAVAAALRDVPAGELDAARRVLEAVAAALEA
jgi:hypothetical protein